MSARVHRAAPLVRGGLSHSSIRCSSSVRMPSAASVRASASEKSRKRTRGGVEGRPEAADVRGDGRRARDGVLHPVVGGVAGALHLEQHAVGEALGEQVAGGGVAHAAGEEGVDVVLDVVGRDAPAA